jgi:hypothetical protein
MIDVMRAALKELEDVLECINQDKMPFDGDDFHETLRTLRQAIKQEIKQEPYMHPEELAELAHDIASTMIKDGWNNTFPLLMNFYDFFSKHYYMHPLVDDFFRLHEKIQKKVVKAINKQVLMHMPKSKPWSRHSEKNT